jgi:hypothetical protein
MTELPIAKPISNAQEQWLIWVDLEMTGLDCDQDQIIEIATIVTDAQLNEIAEGPVFAIGIAGIINKVGYGSAHCNPPLRCNKPSKRRLNFYNSTSVRKVHRFAAIPFAKTGVS